jgi:hypothetical protein
MVNLKDKSGKSLYFSNRKEYYRRLKISRSLKQYFKRKRIIKSQFEEQPQEQPEEEIKTKFKRESAVLTAYYDGEAFFDWRLSIINSKKNNTLAYLQKVLKNKWERWAIGDRNTAWNFVIEALESEFIDEQEASNQPQDKIIWEKR